MNDWLPLVAAVLVAVLANGAGWLLVRSQREKTDADAADILTGSALKMVQRWEMRVKVLESRVEELEGRVKTLERENEALRHGATRLEAQVVSKGLVPEWRMADLARALKASK